MAPAKPVANAVAFARVVGVARHFTFVGDVQFAVGVLVRRVAAVFAHLLVRDGVVVAVVSRARRCMARKGDKR